LTTNHTTPTGQPSRPENLQDVPVSLALLIGTLALIAVMGVWWIGYAAGVTPFPPFDLADLIIRGTPGDLAVWAIANFQFQARNLVLLGGTVAVAVSGVLFGLLLRHRPAPLTGALAGAAASPLFVVISASNDAIAGFWSLAGATIWFGVTLAGLLALAGVWMERLTIDARDSARSDATWQEMHGNRTRRDVLKQATTTTIAIAFGGWVTGALIRNAGLGGGETRDALPLPEVRSALEESSGDDVPLPTPVPAGDEDTSFVAPGGVRPRNTSNDDFFVIDISTRKPALPDTSWTLRIHGLVEREIEVSYPDLLSMPSIEMDGTLMCISYTHGSNLIGSTRWTGVPLRDVLQRSGIGDGVVDLILRGAGGYSDSIPVAKALESTTLLAYGMNGETLPRDHGFPCRLYVPNIYGEKNVKWLQEIEVVDYDYLGYWQERGWSDEAVINTLSTIDTPSGQATPNEDGVVVVGGIAFAGTRGIELVELQVDDGEWQAADLEPYEPELIWQRWRYDWPATSGNHVLTVRAVNGEGVPQDPTPREPFPDGMTGLHTVRVNVS
jgi:DMSO/TMAO reductase YedYZ molybdopterin-dependent catalytic subunit